MKLLLDLISKKYTTATLLYHSGMSSNLHHGKKFFLTKIVIVTHNEECARSSTRKSLNEELCVYQAAQQIIELQEAAQINAGLQPANLGRNTSLHDMKTVVKTWRNRLPIVSDDLSHWSSIFMWRQHHYQGTLLSRNPVKVCEVWKKKIVNT